MIIMVLCSSLLLWSCIPPNHSLWSYVHFDHHGLDIPFGHCGLVLLLIVVVLYSAVFLIVFVFYCTWSSYTLLVLNALIIRRQQHCYSTPSCLLPSLCYCLFCFSITFLVVRFATISISIILFNCGPSFDLLLPSFFNFHCECLVHGFFPSKM